MLGDDGVAAKVARASGGEAGDVAKQAAADALRGRFTHLEEVADLFVRWPATAPATSLRPTSSSMENASPLCETEEATADGASAFEETSSLPGASRNLTLKVRRKDQEGALNWTGYRERCREANHGPDVQNEL
jgi:hypothetical protein